MQITYETVLAARRAAEAATAAWQQWRVPEEMSEADADAEDERLEAEADRLTAEADRLTAEFLRSDEEREYVIYDEAAGTADGDTIRCRPSRVRQEAIDWVMGWAEEGSTTQWIDAGWRCDLTGEDGGVTVTIDAAEPPCPSGHAHVWAQPLGLVGGLKENPGVHGHGGGIVDCYACLLCGCGRAHDSWAQRPDTGEQGLDAATYTPHRYPIETVAISRDGTQAAVHVDGTARLVIISPPKLCRPDPDDEVVDDDGGVLRVQDGRWVYVE